ncbi:hypothetical protein G647_06845 [Cladophialophora carrionii CBS 160.54]|uniref:Uncharacterized protein n=1 Tax=Cladophialophora carrionii CBS 160.54 TaxID=1279043 RepID=V9D765_9EURO|nr:uncharacterized protein G647_06845 [Cladophialophora carrionii CBS 160.54]ETI22769.1 hypothetical protein G647_06845 [Cladophialophora carrionii CBS 160.54]
MSGKRYQGHILATNASVAALEWQQVQGSRLRDLKLDPMQPATCQRAIRNGTLGVVATNGVVVMWPLLVIESQVVNFQPTRKDRQLSIRASRSVVYKLMNGTLADEKTARLGMNVFW